ncbi:MAG TPA: hypothetical protein VNS81_06720, partial [Nocardioides sp.]|nr:hypothetical protein [Nocardioides sp.]
HAPTVVHALERLFLGDEVADDLEIPRTRLTRVIARTGPVLSAVNHGLDRIPSTLPRRTRKGKAYEAAQEERLRRDWNVHHDLVDASPGGGRPHPARVGA